MRKIILLGFCFITASLYGGQLRLSWTDNSDNETGFGIERSVDGGATFVKIGEVAANITTFDDPNLNPNSYCYRVYAFNTYGNSAFSNVACATIANVINPPGELTVPNIMLGTSPSDSFNGNFYVINTSSITVSWASVPNAQSYEIRMVDIDRNIEHPIQNVGMNTIAVINQPRAGHFSVRVRPIISGQTTSWTDSRTIGWIIYWKLAPPPVIIE